MNRFILAKQAVVGLILFLLPACDQQKSNTLNVVSTYSILGDIVHQVGKEKIALHLIVGANRDLHTFEPTPQSGLLLAQADLVFENGLNFEPWLDRLYESSDAHAKRIVVTEGIVPFFSETGEPDPHLWHDVNYAIKMTQTIANALSARDPKNKNDYQANAADYIVRLTVLEAWVQKRVQTIPPQSRRLFTPHDSFGYFARRYHFETMGIALHSFLEEADPSAATLAALVETIKRSQIKAIFTEKGTRSKTMEMIANETHTTIVSRLYADSLSEANGPAASYEKLIRYNMEAITKGLSK
ncbi:MAG: zinc ABC transporter substrate-binding protein [Nitrospirota bacterium]